MAIERNTPNFGNGNGNARMPFGMIDAIFDQAAQTSTQARPKSKIWLKVGRKMGEEFISLPLDQGIDTMQPSQMRGQNVEFAKRLAASNQLLDALQKMGFSLQPGETSAKLNLEVRLFRVNDALDVSNVENEFAIDPATLLAAE